MPSNELSLKTRSFADMLECIKQHQAGVLTDSELILALQCTPNQVAALTTHSSLPYKAALKVSLSDWDTDLTLNNARMK